MRRSSWWLRGARGARAPRFPADRPRVVRGAPPLDGDAVARRHSAATRGNDTGAAQPRLQRFWSTLALGLAAPPFGLGSVVAGSFGIAGAAGALAVLVVGTIVFDLGVQSCLIAHQTIVYAQDPTARSRLNAALVSAMFIGMSCGAFLANRIFERSGFAGVCVMGAIAAGGALVMRALTSEAR